MNPVIEIKSISKSYFRDMNQVPYQTFRESISGVFKRIKKERFAALNNVTLDVDQGEKIGIIGKNGAGKTTLLKVLSRITPPDSGEIVIRGKVASLLEVGTGFHPELTGRENIFFNGAILGLTRREILERFDEIIDFSGIYSFIDTPLKHYSTGMAARLAFSVAAHLDPDILLVDEVLSVGDAEFQKRCLTKMSDLSRSGRTVLFVSHNLAAVRQLCRRCVYIQEGSVVADGPVNETIERYLADNSAVRGSGVFDLTNFHERKGSFEAKMTGVVLRNQTGAVTNRFHIGDDLILHLFFEAQSKLGNVKIVIDICEPNGNLVCNVYDSDSGFGLRDVSGKKHVSACFNDLRFYPGEYTINIELCSEVFNYKCDIYDQLTAPVSFEMINTTAFDRALKRHAGLLYLTPKWQDLQV